MNQLNIEPFEAEHATIEVMDIPEGALLKFRGTIDHVRPGEFLEPLFERIHTGALEKRIPHVTIDLDEMEFFNSSGIKLLATWLLKRRALDPSVRYGVKVIYSGQVTWQVATLRAIEAISSGTLQTECI